MTCRSEEPNHYEPDCACGPDESCEVCAPEPPEEEPWEM